MKVTYSGTSGSGGDVIHADPEVPDTNTVTHCPPGEPVDLPDDVAVAQMLTGNFEPVDKEAKTALAKAQAAAPDDEAEPDPPADDPPAETSADPDTQEN